MKKLTEFHRDIFYDCVDFIEDKSESAKVFCSLLGPRKCGKSECFKQLSVLYNVPIYDFSNYDNKEMYRIINEICNLDNTIILIDEITYCNSYDLFLNKLASAFIGRTDVKVLITGSQKQAINYFCEQSFSTEVKYIVTSFITFKEWVRYRYNLECSEDKLFLIKDYILYSRDFTKISDNKNYIRSCINETIESFSKAYRNVRYTTDINSVSENKIIGVFYSILFSLHNDSSLKTFRKGILQLENIPHFVQGLELDGDDLVQKAKIKFTNIFGKLKKTSIEEFRIIISFLIDCDLITVTKRINSLEEPNNDFWDDFINSTYEDIFRNYIFCVKHPMFYSNIIEELVIPIKRNFYDNIDNRFFGSVYECIARGYYGNYLNTHFLYEYQEGKNLSGAEIDIVDFITNTLVELSVGKNHEDTLQKLSVDSFNKIFVTDGALISKSDVNYYSSHDFLIWLCEHSGYDLYCV